MTLKETPKKNNPKKETRDKSVLLYKRLGSYVNWTIGEPVYLLLFSYSYIYIVEGPRATHV